MGPGGDGEGAVEEAEPDNEKGHGGGDVEVPLPAPALPRKAQLHLQLHPAPRRVLLFPPVRPDVGQGEAGHGHGRLQEANGALRLPHQVHIRQSEREALRPTRDQLWARGRGEEKERVYMNLQRTTSLGKLAQSTAQFVEARILDHSSSKIFG